MQVHKSETVMNDLNPLWKPQETSVQVSHHRRLSRVSSLRKSRGRFHSKTSKNHALLQCRHETRTGRNAKGVGAWTEK